ncbi:uncharacterized protein LOC124357989 isoform X1 [Homalodisca vitripennis]|uniref:uncharacterized protein LOC124357989 isoform X1 n=1 Tax=Homalodisca vitripennis TaxID=197043 RepID=UPI001EEBB40B|nr:uncharacterized protein LOC124357989 isoform X1 [Homalodisca vitripennis]
MNADTESSLKCYICGKVFKQKSYRDRHMQCIHKQNCKGEPLLEVNYTCYLCDKKLRNKRNLQVHLNAVHSQQDDFNLLKCDKCNYSTAYKSNLRRHQSKHRNHKPQQLLNCSECNAIYSTLTALRLHEKKTHKAAKIERAAIQRKCPMCPFLSFSTTRNEMNKHLENKHELTLCKKQYYFESIEAFHEWRLKAAKESKCAYQLRNRSNNRLYYACNRSGFYKSRGLNKRKRPVSCKMDAYCPANIKCFIDTSGGVNVEYMPLHVGHNNELKHKRLTTEVKKFIEKKLASKTPHYDVFQMVRSTLTDQELQRLHLLTIEDFANIERDFNLTSEVQKQPFDPVGVECWYRQLKDSKDTACMFYKPQGEILNDYPELKKDDFVLIYMSENQKVLLDKYKKDTICIDGTHGTNKLNFQLYTILILDISQEGFPIAFMFSNREDDNIMSLFFQKIKDVVGVVHTNVFMSDIKETFYNAWVKVMGPVQLRLFCTWHVLKAWRNNLKKIRSKEKKDATFKILQTLLQERDINTFHTLLEGALKQLDSEQHTSAFSNYFNDYFVKNHRFKLWAYCYRMSAGINTNMSIESFNKVLKYFYLEGKKVQSLDETLCALINFIRDKLFDCLIKLEKSKVVTKLQILRRRHIESYEIADCNMITLENEWQVLSSKAQEFYSVKKVKNCNCCVLLCPHCNSCFHEYICSCMDNSIKNNMCIHIHLVARSLCNKTEESSIEIYDCEVVEMDIDDYMYSEEQILKEITCDINNTPNDQARTKRICEKIDFVIEYMKRKTTTSDQKNYIDKHLTQMLTTLNAMATNAQIPVKEEECNRKQPDSSNATK